MKVRVFVDLDELLLKTDVLFDKFVDQAVQVLGVTQDQARAPRVELDEIGFTPERYARSLSEDAEVAQELANRLRVIVKSYARAFIYKDRVEALGRMKHQMGPELEIVLVTKGDPGYQYLKWSSLGEFVNFFSSALFVSPDQCKGEAIAAEGCRARTVYIFFDDMQANVDAVSARAPWVHCFLVLPHRRKAKENDPQYILEDGEDIFRIIEEARRGELA